MAALTRIEKLILCDIAREAYDLWVGRAEFELSCGGASPFDAWRHREQAKAVGFRSLVHCDSSHFERLKIHFQNLRREHTAARDRELETAAGQQSLF